MNTIITEMLQQYEIKTLYDKKNALKEVLQEIILCGLSRGGFFKESAFYGGTALRIFYGLDRFSEDIDFSLVCTNLEFDIKKFFPVLKKELSAFGIQAEIDEKEKTKDSHIRSAFLKGNTKEHLLLFYPDSEGFSQVPNNELIKIKFEVDVDPPRFATFERKYRLRPIPYDIQVYDESSLFAGKLHAVLARSWENRIKGRDLYDYVFYRSKNISVNLKHLQERLIQTKHLHEDESFDMNDLKNMLHERFNAIDFSQAKEDVTPFIKDVSVLQFWNTDFFTQITEGLKER